MEPRFNTTKNFKRGQYIMNRYRYSDCAIILSTIAISVAMIVVYLNVFISKQILVNVTVFILLLLPMGIVYLLFLPMPTYFNLLDFLRNALHWFTKKKSYKWEGIHLFDEEDEIQCMQLKGDHQVYEKNTTKYQKKKRSKKTKKRSS